MKKGLFFFILCLTSLLFVFLAFNAFEMRQIDRRLDMLPAQLAQQGWRFSWEQKVRIWHPWGSHLILRHPLLSDASGQGWTGEQIRLSPDLFHPLSASLSLGGVQLVRLGKTLTLNGGEGHGRLDLTKNQLVYSTRTITASNLPIGEIDTLSLDTVSLRLVLGQPGHASSVAWGLDLRAQSVLPKLMARTSAGGAASDGGVTDHLSALLALLPPPRQLHLVIAALKGTGLEGETPRMTPPPSGEERRVLTHNMSYEQFLIQEASFVLGPLSCVARGTLTGEGEGTLWTHLEGLQAFARYWVSHTPSALRRNPDYSHLLAMLDEQTARIPDRIDLPLPLNRGEVLLPNHFLATIRGN